MFRVIFHDDLASRDPRRRELEPRRRGVSVVQQRDVVQQQTCLHDLDNLGALRLREFVIPHLPTLWVAAVRLVVILEVKVQTHRAKRRDCRQRASDMELD